jgi:hypothetical protein
LDERETKYMSDGDYKNNEGIEIGRRVHLQMYSCVIREDGVWEKKVKKWICLLTKSMMLGKTKKEQSANEQTLSISFT